MLILKNFRKEADFFCFVRNEVFCCTSVCVCVNLDFKRVNVEYARGTLNFRVTIPLLARAAFVWLCMCM